MKGFYIQIWEMVHMIIFNFDEFLKSKEATENWKGDELFPLP